ncbi:cytochrome ubiquinol oxidase subunit I [Pseudogracilibacillus auburnensis]|uniref:Cytochrome bd-I ubiquinol oxidase subunit 1 apoprotein n=1 Tax=Pseudogracilibacillus auburnensis TaxID=1494959 RepID=A0A2V3VR61_9BACI|nr:cytochrome ubiquinol oxidase subunit I [Pseudogracilibacillus auburnensis]PXW82495.1 cytochrome bd-I ubiquinol oxidase subunit 1 apoprotein [Pseudogracilibacillus auburnensis]
MDPLVIARLQFASTTIFHYFFVPVSIGLAFTIAIMQTLYVIKGNDIYKKMTKFWAVLFLINFAVGVVTGILQEFQFGMNWSTYSRFVGDVFGPSLAIEGLLAFFMESTFIGIWVFGWNRLSKKVHLASIWLVSIGTILSAFWILSANSFMQNPVGFEFADGRAQMNDFLAILTNPHLWAQFPHVLLTSLATGAFVVAGISAWKIARKHDLEMFKKSFRIAITIGAVSAFAILFTGHWQAQYLVKSQPMKMAAAEALWETSSDPAPFTVLAKINTEETQNDFEIQIPFLLSFLSFNQFSGSLEGMNQLQEMYVEKYGPGDYIPPVQTLFWVFRIMTGAGGVMLLLGFYGMYASRKDTIANNKWYLKVMTYGIALPFIANTAGWILTEMGRQPWVVFGLMKTEDAVSPSVTANEMLFSLISFTLLYTVLAIVTIYLFVRHIKKKDHDEKEHDVAQDPFDKEGGAEVVS